MKMYTLTTTQVVARPIREVFAFFEKPENLTRITPQSMRFEILTPSPATMKAGAVIDYSVSIFGLATRWTTLIADYESPYRFTDVQLKGPYSFWHHAHTFEEIDGGTRITDEVRYILPFGYIGRIAHAAVIRRKLSHIFAYREQAIRTIFETSPGYPGRRDG